MSMARYKYSYAFILLSLFFTALPVVHAEEVSSQSYKILTPSITSGGGFASSSSYSLFGVISEFAHSTSTSLTFGSNPGFAAFAIVSTPTVSITSGDGQVSLSWTAAQGFTGWTVSGYDVGQSVVSGGPYTYTALGNVTSSTRSSLTNGTTYYFVILPKDALGNRIATSTEVSGSPASSGTSSNTSGGGTTGGGGSVLATNVNQSVVGATVILSGRAYPGSTVTILKDSVLQSQVPVQESANFTSTISNLQNATYLFSVYAQDTSGRRSSSITIPVTVVSGVTTTVNGIFLAPTIDVDKIQVKRGNPMRVFGQSSPESLITIAVNSTSELFFQTTSDKYGVYAYSFLTTPLEIGNHSTHSNASQLGEVSSASGAIGFKVGSEDILKEKTTSIRKTIRGDLNGDGRVNLIDFSIEAYWYKKKGFPVTYDLNGDKSITLVDFSIMASNWTG